MSSAAQPSESRPDDPGPPDVLSPPPADGYVDGVPTFDHVRDRIEERAATAQGTTELAEETAAGRTAAQQYDDREAAAKERLEQIRRSLRD